MSQPNFKPSEEFPILGISVAILAILVFVLSWRVGSYISLQNDNLDRSIQNAKRQLEQGQPMDQNFVRLLDVLIQDAKRRQDGNLIQLLLQYAQQTQDRNALQLLVNHGILQVQQPGAAQAPAQPAAAAAQPAQPAQPAATPAR
jgi:hypothetical protein